MRDQISKQILDGVIGHLKSLILDSFTLVALEPGHCRISLTITQDNCNVYGFAHGGTLYALCDTASGAAVYSLGYNNVTLQGNINYMKSANIGTIYVDCTVHHQGRKTAVTHAVVTNEDNEELCMAVFTMYIKGQVD